MDNSFEKLIGRVLDKRYKIENVVGIGGMAYVLKASDLQNGGNAVAVKILNEEFNSDENAVKRFINESKAVSILNSPNVVKIYDVAMSENLKYIVMEFIDGITLKDYIDKVGHLGWKEACHYVRQILKALSHAHEKGIVHRDIKPQNVMLLRDGTVKVTDFGIAKMPTSEPLTMTDKAIGTVNYISPEQASGSTVDEKSDLYSVGVMLYEMLTGKLPFTADSPVAVAMMQVNETPVEPRQINPQIPVGLEQIVLKAMSKDPTDRFNSAMSMEKAIEYFVKNPAIVFSGTNNAGAKKSNKEEEKVHRSMLPIILGVTFSFVIVCVVSVLVLLGRWGTSCTDLFENPEKVINNADNLFGSKGNNDQSRRIKIKDYTGKIFTEDMRKELVEAGFIVHDKYLEEPGVEHGKILRQDPAPDTEKIDPKYGSRLTLTLYINNNPAESYVMPECLRINVQDAKDMIMARFGNYMTEQSIIVQEYYKSDVAVGVVYECNPGPGAPVDITNMPEITLYVSKGPEPKQVIMPQIIGLTKNEAVRLLTENEIQFEDEKMVDDGPVGRVVDATKQEGDIFMNDEIVTIYISTKDDTDNFTMPNCVGDTKETAILKIRNKFRLSESEISVVEEYNEETEKGKVFKTTPPAGDMVMDFTATRITIYVSLGPVPREVQMPDVLEYSLERAKSILNDEGFYNIKTQYVESMAVKDTVVDASFRAGAVLYQDSEIILYLSNGGEEPDSDESNDNNQDEQQDSLDDLLDMRG